MKRIENLPNWCLTNKNPGFYDTESATVLEETAKVYAKVQELINDYNLFVEEIEQITDDFKTEISGNQEKFETDMTTLMHDYIHQIDTEIAKMKNDIVQTATNLVEEMFENGEVVITSQYDEQTESLNMIADTNGGVE